MGMRLTSLTLVDFRNYEHYEISGIGGLTVFTGLNGVGKTNILEGIHLITSASSFRHSPIEQIVRHGASHALVKAELSDENRSLCTSLTLAPGKKKYSINGKTKGTGDVRGILPAVSFVPDDLEIAKKSSSVKRNALDGLGVQISKNYHVIHRDYEKAIRYKNRLLKDEEPQELVDAINDTLLTCATQLHCYRHALYEKMMPVLAVRYDEISHGEGGFSSCYIPSWVHLEEHIGEMDSEWQAGDEAHDRDSVREQLERALSAYAAEERARKRCIVGPHNDKIAFFLERRDVSQFASQGQQRSIVLAWKLAEVEMVRRTLGTNPVLLLDDVMSELDEFRRAMLVECLGEDIQAFITATDLSAFSEGLLSRARVIALQGREKMA